MDCSLDEQLDFYPPAQAAAQDRSVVTATQLVQIQPCQYALMTLQEGGKLSNLVLNFDVSLESACQTVYIAPLASAGGSLENVTLTGDIRVTGSTQILNAATVFTYSFGNYT